MVVMLWALFDPGSYFEGIEDPGNRVCVSPPSPVHSLTLSSHLSNSPLSVGMSVVGSLSWLPID